MTAKFSLPDPHYMTVPELAARWLAHVDAVYYVLDNGELPLWVKVNKHQLPTEMQDGPSPHMVVELPDYAQLEWQHGEGSTALLCGIERRCLDIAGGRELTLPAEHPATITRADLVVPYVAVQDFEDAHGKVRPFRSTERTTMLLMIGALARGYWGSEVENPYTCARDLLDILRNLDTKLSQETLATKLKEAVALTTAAQTDDPPRFKNHVATGREVLKSYTDIEPLLQAGGGRTVPHFDVSG